MRINPRTFVGATATTTLVAAALVLSAAVTAGDDHQVPDAPSEEHFIGSPPFTASTVPVPETTAVAFGGGLALSLDEQLAQLETPVVVPHEQVMAVDTAEDNFYAADPALVCDGDVWRLFTTRHGWSRVPTWESVDRVHVDQDR